MEEEEDEEGVEEVKEEEEERKEERVSLSGISRACDELARLRLLIVPIAVTDA